MKKKLLPIYLGLTMLISVIGLVACSNEDSFKSQKVETKTTLVFNSLTKEFYGIKDKNLNEANNQVYEFVQKFESDSNMPSFESSDDLKEYITKNPEKASGEYNFYINGEVVYKVSIAKGIKINEIIFPISDNGRYGCSYEGVRRCAVDRIQSMNWYDTWGCIAAGMACVMDNMISCGIDIC
ncbi:hypothetical protein [Flavobacterium luminosum]|uniref:Lipoprotein n=1 Tax=Flavobacterium luminosum TaxID=2949086 RepID=A0ABT0TL99_9FLAO|nr:hypothetical protein [Flavobacterium sp. HXWNR70]MCL9808237.1 hypothetical protein [Flavobacterium sp. HXWNR70]